MKKEYSKPEVAVVCVAYESMLAVSNSESMDRNEIPGGDDVFNVKSHGGDWNNLWK